MEPEGRGRDRIRVVPHRTQEGKESERFARPGKPQGSIGGRLVIFNDKEDTDHDTATM